MGAYHYHALTKTGQHCRGVIEADSERQARQLLRDQGIIPTQIKPLSKQSSSQRARLSVADLSLFTRQLATLLSAGIPVEEALRGVSEQTDKDKVRELIIGVRSKVVEGYSLAQAMDEYPRTFGELYRATVGAGEQTGRLDSVLEKLADYIENQQKTRQKIQQALIYPSLMIFVSIGIISFLLAFVVPKIIEVFSNSGQTLPQMTEWLMVISSFIQHYGVYTLLFMIILSIVSKQCLKYKRVKTKWHYYLLKIPIIRYVVISSNVARYIHTFAILFAAGVSVLDTMRVASTVVNNLIIRQRLVLALSRVREGSSISSALKDSGFLSPMAVHLIASGEKSGQIANMMERAAASLDNDVKRLVDTALTLLEPFVILSMGVVVLFIVMATLLPIFSMEQLVN